MKIKEIKKSKEYIKDLKSMKDKTTKEVLLKKLKKITKNPDRAKHLRNVMRLRQSERVGKFRLIYEWSEDGEILYLLRFRKRGKAYK